MASSITYINWALVDQKVNAALRFGLPNRDLFSMRVMRLEENAKNGDAVYVPFATDPTVATKTLGTRGTATGALAGTAVTLANPKVAAWDAIEGNMTQDVMAEYWADKIAGGMYALAKEVLDASLAYVTASNFGNADADKIICAPADFTSAVLGQLWGKGAKKIKQRSRSLILNADYAAAVIGNSSLMTVFATAGGANPLSTGVLPQLIGHNTAAYADLPENSEHLGGAVFGQAALAVACAPISPLTGSVGAIVDRREIVHEETGFSALYTETVDGSGTVHGALELMYGVSKGQDSVVRLVME